MSEHLTRVVIDAGEAAENRDRGWWRDATLYDDVAAAATRQPDKVAIVGHRHGTVRCAATVDVLSYRHSTPSGSVRCWARRAGRAAR